jgi:hypothetical protein
MFFLIAGISLLLKGFSTIKVGQLHFWHRDTGSVVDKPVNNTDIFSNTSCLLILKYKRICAMNNSYGSVNTYLRVKEFWSFLYLRTWRFVKCMVVKSASNQVDHFSFLAEITAPSRTQKNVISGCQAFKISASWLKFFSFVPGKSRLLNDGTSKWRHQENQ